MKRIHWLVLFCLFLLFPGLLLTGRAIAGEYVYGWTKTMGGTGRDVGFSVTAVNSGDVFVTGHFSDTVDFDPTAGMGGTDIHTSTGAFDIFLTKLSSDGKYGMTMTMGGTSNIRGERSVTTDGAGNIFMTGRFSETVDFDPSAGMGGTDIHTSAGKFDIFLTKINSDGTYGGTKTVGGPGRDVGLSVTADPAGNVFVVGSFFRKADFGPLAGMGGTDIHTSSGAFDTFLTKINQDGTYGWTKTVGEMGNVSGRSVMTDVSGNIFVAGNFRGTVDFDPSTGMGGTDIHTSAGFVDIFLTKINSNGTYGGTKTMGGPGRDVGLSVTAGSSGDVFVTGHFSDTVDFNPTAGMGGTDIHTSVGLRDIFLTKINSNGTYGWTKTMGGTGGDVGMSVTSVSSGNVFVTGYFSDTVDFDPPAGMGGTDIHTSVGVLDIFLTKINSNGTYGGTKTMGGTGVDAGFSVTMDVSGNVFVTGGFSGTVDFDPTAGTDPHTSVGMQDIFLTKFLTSDFDGDGIFNDIDSQPNAPSLDFSDGTTSGTITDPGNQALEIMDAPAPLGIKITSLGGTMPATITVCGGVNMTITAGDTVIVTCGSAIVEVKNGSVDFKFHAADGTVATVILNEGEGLTFKPETNMITASVSNADSVVVIVGNKELVIAPNETVSFDKSKTPPVKFLKKPKKLSITVINDNTAELSWQDMSEGEDGFIVERRARSNKTWKEVGRTGPEQTTYEDNTIKSGKRHVYFYRVKAFNSVTESEYSEKKRIKKQKHKRQTHIRKNTRQDKGLKTPKKLSVKVVDNNTVELSWKDMSDGEDGFIIERKTRKNKRWKEVGRIGADKTLYPDKTVNFDKNRTYFYRVKAFNSVSESGYTEQKRVKRK